MRKSNNRRIARACEATIGDRMDETRAGLFEVRKIGDGYFTLIGQCKDTKVCTILLCGASKDILNEVERNLQDDRDVARILYQGPTLVPGGGATEMEVAQRLRTKAKTITTIARTQDKEVGDGITSGIVLAAKMLGASH